MKRKITILTAFCLAFVVALVFVVSMRPSEISIRAMLPSEGESLKSNSKVLLQLAIDYRLQDLGGKLDLVVQTPAGLLSTKSVPLVKKEGSLELVEEIDVPDTSELHVFVPIYESGQTTSTVVDSLVYTVN